MQYIGSNIRFIFTKIKELLNSHNTDNSAHSELFKSWKRLRNPNNADIADALAATHKNGIGDVLVEVKDDTTFALEDIKLFFRPASFKLISANESHYEGIYITMDGTQGRYVAKTFADSEIMTPEGPSTISTPSELALYPAASDAVLYTPQTLTEAQQKQARANIGALDENIHTTEVDVKRTLNGIGTNLFYVRKGWLKPCPDDANDELINSYTTAVLFVNFISSTVDSVKRHAKGAYTIYQQGLASANLQFTDNPLDVERYISWDITTNNNKTYLTYHHYGHSGFSETCRYCVEDDSYDNVRVVNALNTRQTGDNPNATVNQFYLATNPTKDMHVATKQYVDIAKTEAQQLGLTTATPGKTIKVKTVQDGKPTEWEVANIYEKPADGIPKSDLADDVQTSLAKADTALQSQTIPDWNQNDETAADYVKNRPFYTGDPVETVLVEESTVSFAAAGGMYLGQLESTFEATVGETYKVYWDGAAYECACVNFNDVLLIGNLSIIGAGSDTGEPFRMVIRNGEGIEIATADTSAAHTFSISGTAAPIVKIPAKFIDKDASGYIVVHNSSTMTEEEGRNYDNAILKGEAAFIIWESLYISGISVDTETDSTGVSVVYLYVNTPNGESYRIAQNSEGLFNLNDRKLSEAVFPNNKAAGDVSSEIQIVKGKIRISSSRFYSGVGTTDALFYVKPNGTKSKSFEVLGNGEAVAPALILYSSTADSTKKFKITVDDSGVPTITDESDSTNTWKPTNLPTVTSSDSGKFLRVSDTGEWVAETILSATVSNNTLIIR